MANQSSTSTAGENKRHLQRQIGRARESLAETVEEIKETAEQGYASVKQTVSGVLDYRDQFQKDPLVWSLGALSAGFALGYTLGFAHKSSKHGKHSQVVQFADRVVDELSSVGQSLLMPGLSVKIKEFFGVDFAELLRDMRGSTSEREAVKRQQRPRLKSTRHTSTRRRKSRPRKK
ncbi:MAG: hypothetical protein JO354_06935 [Verrucomicrobia bacterium]|nr:hypothetical protein [Verrucomicrobiota bacterium]